MDGQNRQATASTAHTSVASLSVFNQNHHFAYIYKKTEKLVTAVYMITNFIKDNEPLKWRIREKALELLSLNISFNTVSLSDRKDLLKKYQAYSIEIVSLSSIAHHAGLISEMNFEILRREFNSLVSTIEKDENKKSNEETVILNPSFFDAPKDRSAEASSAAIVSPMGVAGERKAGEATDVLYKGHVSAPAPTAFAPAPAPAPAAPTPIKDIAPKPAKKADSKDDRQAAIIKLLSKKGGLSIKDFADIIKGVSEKTIQRELLAMVASGILKKEGERRWSTYSLAK